MSVSEKIKAIDKKFKQNKAQYDLDRQIDKIYILLLGNIRKYEFLTGKDVLPENELLEKAITLKRFEYFLLGKELKSQTDISKRKYKGLDKIFISYRDNSNVNESLIKKEKII